MTYTGFCDMIGRNSSHVANVMSHIKVFHQENLSDNALVFIHLSDKFQCRGKNYKLKIKVQIENKSLAFCVAFVATGK